MSLSGAAAAESASAAAASAAGAAAAERACASSAEPVAVLELPAPPEPVELRQQLRAALLDGAQWEVQFGSELGVGEVLWPAWGEALSGAGMTRTQFAAVVRGCRRELWFWVLGDRLWSQAVTGLAGRLLRRVPPA